MDIVVGIGRRSAATPHLLALVLAMSAMLVLGSVVVSGTRPVSADTTELPPSTCPQLTDSIRRLYLASFNREPDAAGFVEAVRRYQTGETDLPTLAEALIGSDEFDTRYGPLSDERFVELVYRNTLRRAPGDSDRDHWVTTLGTGYPRGELLLAFSESEPFVRRTGTATPLAGFLRWYPPGAHWYCGIGSVPNLPIQPLSQPVLYADFMFRNGNEASTSVALHTAVDGERFVTMTESELPPGVTSYRWDGRFSGAEGYGDSIQIEAGSGTGWAVVFYPDSIGAQRLGWQISR